MCFSLYCAALVFPEDFAMIEKKLDKEVSEV